MENEQALVDRFCNGDVSAFQDIVELYKKKVYYLAYDITGNHYDAEDISQEVFIKVFRSLKKFRRDAKMSSWLYQITVNTSIDSLRTSSSRMKKLTDQLEEGNLQKNLPESGETTNDPERSLEAAMIQKQLSQVLQCVSPRERAVFVMRHYNDFKMNEIAEILNVSVGTVKSLLFRAIKKLRRELSIYMGNPEWEVTYE